MNIVIDLQACQGESRFRGIGRYSMSLSKAIVKQAGLRGHEVTIVLNRAFPELVSNIRTEFANLLPHDSIKEFDLIENTAEMYPANTSRARLAEKEFEKYLSSLKPDIVHIASLFEGWYDDVIGSVGTSQYKLNTAVTLYDLIPLVLSDLYLIDPAYKNYYYRKLESLNRSDMLLAISEYSRQEAIDLLGFDADNVFNISAAIDDKFQIIEYSPEQRKNILVNYNITNHFVLYVPGGFDPRKNFERLIEAFSKLPEPIRNEFQLVIASRVPDGIEEFFVNKSKLLGLKVNQLVLTGYVPEDDLVALYNLCNLFIFPSIHEGFGLPILEAMACGAPVIGSNLTSVPEVLGRKDAMFNAMSVESISQSLYKGLTDRNFVNDLREHARVQTGKFSWDNSASIVIDAFEYHFNLVSKNH